MYILLSVLVAVVSIAIGYLLNKDRRIIVNFIFSVFFGGVTWFMLWRFCMIISWEFTSWMWLLAFILGIRGALAGAVEEYDYNYRGLIPLLIFVPLIIRAIASTPMSNAEEYHAMLSVDTVSSEELIKDLVPIDVDQLELVDEKEARIVIESDLGQITSLGSTSEVGRFDKSMLNGSFTIKDGNGEEHHLTFDNQLVWLAPIEFSGFIKQNKFERTEGLVLVSVTDPDFKYLITEINGKKMNLKFLEDGYFGSKLERHIRNSGYQNIGLTDYSFEADDFGSVKYVVTTYEKTIGIYGFEANGVLVVDPITGEIEEFDMDHIPNWIENVQPVGFVSSQIGYWGRFVHGYINLSNKDKLKKTDGEAMVVNDSTTFYYTGIQSTGSDNGTNGYMLVNTRTKAAKFYKISGFTENAAKANFEKIVVNFGYTATHPKMYNIHNQESYFSLLKDNNGKNQMYGFCSVEKYDYAGVGKTPLEAYNKYLQSKAFNKETLNIDEIVEEKIVEIVIGEIVSEGDMYYIIPEGGDSIELYGSSKKHKEIKWSKVGDKAKVVYGVGEKENSISLSYFDLLRLKL